VAQLPGGPPSLGGQDIEENLVARRRLTNHAAERWPPPRWARDLGLLGPPELARRAALIGR
jgi:hypothetical protein